MIKYNMSSGSGLRSSAMTLYFANNDMKHENSC